MPNGRDEDLRHEYPVPDADGGLPAFIELSDGAWISLQNATKAQVRAAARLHILIAERHFAQADRLRRYAERRSDFELDQDDVRASLHLAEAESENHLPVSAVELVTYARRAP
jgi:hypothetical protein